MTNQHQVSLPMSRIDALIRAMEPEHPTGEEATQVVATFERAFLLGRAETSLVLDAFNALGASTITGIQTSLNGSLDLDNFSSYNQTTARVPPRTMRITAAVRF